MRLYGAADGHARSGSALAPASACFCPCLPVPVPPTASGGNTYVLGCIARFTSPLRPLCTPTMHWFPFRTGTGSCSVFSCGLLLPRSPLSHDCQPAVLVRRLPARACERAYGRACMRAWASGWGSGRGSGWLPWMHLGIRACGGGGGMIHTPCSAAPQLYAVEGNFQIRTMDSRLDWARVTQFGLLQARPDATQSPRIRRFSS